jgi:hypothetical protein
VTGDDRLKGNGVTMQGEPLDELTFRESGNRSGLEEPLELSENGFALHCSFSR